MRLSGLKTGMLLSLRRGPMLSGELWLTAQSARRRAVPNQALHDALRELADLGLIVYRPSRLSDHALNTLLRDLRRPGAAMRPAPARDFIRLTDRGYHVADLALARMRLPPGHRTVITPLLTATLRRCASSNQADTAPRYGRFVMGDEAGDRRGVQMPMEEFRPLVLAAYETGRMGESEAAALLGITRPEFIVLAAAAGVSTCSYTRTSVEAELGLATPLPQPQSHLANSTHPAKRVQG